MKKRILKSSLFIFTIIGLISCNQEVKVPADSFTVSGTVTGLDTEFMTRSVTDKNGKRSSDTIFVKDGTFTYTAKIDQAEHILFGPKV